MTKGDRYRALYTRGKTVRDIADRFGVHPATVRAAIERDKRIARHRDRRDAFNERQRESYRARAGGAVRLYRCSFCRGAGHQSRTCDSRWTYLQPDSQGARP